jgi:ABC-type ATPase with predicted acetyltransferase domain
MSVILDTPDMLVKRRDVPKGHAVSFLPEIYVERGTKEDWDLLHELHYKAENLGIGPKIYRCVLNGQTIGVGVMTVPKMLLSGRNELFKHLRPNSGGRDSRLINRYRVEWLNAHACTNSRLVLDTMYRGAGIAYRMQNIMMRMTGYKLIEFQSSMSKFNPFAAKAGMRFTKPKRSANYERGLAWFRRWFESIPTDFVGVMIELNAMPSASRDKCVAEMRKFYYDFSSMEKSGDNRMNGTSRVDGLTVEKLLKNLQQLVFASPLYGIYINPDYDDENDCPVELPHQIPLLAFDNQLTDAPLNLSLLR